MLAAHRVGDTVRGVRVPQRRNRARACARGRGHRTLPRLRGRHDHGGPLPGVQMAATGMMRDDVAERMLASLDANPERVADYTLDIDPQVQRTDGKPQGQGGQGARYLDWIAKELKPFIDSHYRTRRGAETTAIMGSSLGGIISLAAAERYPDVFGCVAAVSPSLWWNGGSVIERWKSKPPAIHRLWIDMGDQERAGLCDELRRLEKAVQPAYGRSLHAEVIPGGRHDEPSWSTRLPRILKFLVADRNWQLVDPPEPVPPPCIHVRPD